MSTRESLELECDTPDCTYTLGYFSNHSSLQHKSTKDGWYRDAWTDRCPECVAKMSERQEMVRTATVLKVERDLTPEGSERVWTYVCAEPPICGHRFVLASSATIGGRPEVFLFPVDKDLGEPTNWTELEGSQINTLDTEAVLRDAGWELLPHSGTQRAATTKNDIPEKQEYDR